MSGQPSPSGKFYVYELVDPRDASTFYVGKGQRKRYANHLKEAQSGVHGPKCNRIREILDAGHEYRWQIVGTFQDEQAAYDAEIERIAAYGLENLTNILPGGGRAWEARQREKARPFMWTEKTVSQISHGLAQSLKLLCGGRVFIGDFDITEAVKSIIGRVISDVGVEALAKAVRKHGVEVVYG